MDAVSSVSTVFLAKKKSILRRKNKVDRQKAWFCEGKTRSKSEPLDFAKEKKFVCGTNVLPPPPPRLSFQEWDKKQKNSSLMSANSAVRGGWYRHDVLMCRCVDVSMCCVDVLMCTGDVMCWCVDVFICWCVDVLMCWCIDVLMCWCVHGLCWCAGVFVDVLMCRCDVFLSLKIKCEQFYINFKWKSGFSFEPETHTNCRNQTHTN